jgi:pyruvate/2-oxoglutarate dehydrogenase complex dihydrolipoamide dehydrogenase (E3) component
VEKRIQDRKNLHWYHGHARFLAPHRVGVGEEELESDRIFIDAGARANIPHVEGLDQVNYMTNASILD